MTRLIRALTVPLGSNGAVSDVPESPLRGKHAASQPPRDSLHRCVLLTLASAVVPGSGLLLTRHRRYGWFLIPFGVLAFAFVIWAVTAGQVTMRHWLVGTTSLQVIAVVLVLVAFIWLASVVITYVVARPRDRRPGPVGPRRGGHRGSGGARGVPAGCRRPLRHRPRGASSRASSAPTPARRSGTIDYGTIQKSDPFAGQSRLNILLLGGDGGADRAGVRTDTMIVASVDTKTGNTVLLSLPRNLLHAPLPPDTALSKAYGKEFYGAGPEGNWMLNAMYRLLPADHPEIYAGSDNPGADALKVTIGYALGLKIDYYALVELSGFKKMVNALGGITLNINYRIPIGGDVDRGIPPNRYLEPGPNQHLGGEDALWYARGRYGVIGGDYSRMDRQRCFIDAMVAQADPATVLTRFSRSPRPPRNC